MSDISDFRSANSRDIVPVKYADAPGLTTCGRASGPARHMGDDLIFEIALLEAFRYQQDLARRQELKKVGWSFLGLVACMFVWWGLLEIALHAGAFR